MSEIEQKIHNGIDAILGVGGLAYRDDGLFAAKPQQLDYAHRAASGFCRFDKSSGKTALNMLQAATGTGKTVGYLVPLFLYSAYTGQRVAISTFTRHLQRQILEKDAVLVRQWVSEVSGVSLCIGRRLGKANYVSIDNCEQTIDLLRRDGYQDHGETISFLSELIAWAGETKDDVHVNTGVLEDFLEDRAWDALPGGISRRDICLDASSSASDCASFFADVERSKNTDVVVVNHALMVMNAYRWATLLDGQFNQKISVAVFDEADRLEDAASSVLAANVSIHRLTQNADKVDALFGVKAVADACRKLYDFAMAQKVASEGARVVRQDETLGGLIKSAVSALEPLVKAWRPKTDDLLGECTAKDRVMADLADEYNDLRRVKDALLDTDNSALLSWSPIKEYPSLRVGQPDQGRILSRMWNLPKEGDGPLRGYLDAALFTSATLTDPLKPIPDTFDNFARSVGIVRHAAKGSDSPIHNVQLDLLQVYQPHKFGEMKFVLADPRAENPSIRGDVDIDGSRTEPKWLEYCATMIRSAKAAGGRVLVLTLSWSDTIGLAALLEGMDGLLVHKRGEPIRGVIWQYEACDGSVLISPGAWEGVDLPGMVDNLVVTRIPFSPPDRPDHDLMRIHLISKGFERKKIDGILKNKDVIGTRRKLEQGFGRGIRATTDKVTVWVADPRFPYPEAWAGTFDPIMLAAPARSSLVSLRSCIARRFVDTAYPEAKLCLLDGSIHTVI